MTQTQQHRRTARRPVVPEDLFRFRFLMGADLAPDGRSVVYALSRSDRESNAEHVDLYLLDVKSGTSRPLTEGDGLDAAPAFSPDGRSIAFLSTRSGAPQIFVTAAEGGGEVRRVTSLQRGVVSGPVWSPDGSQIAFIAGPQSEPRDPLLPYRVSRAMWRADGIGLVDDAVADVYVVKVPGGEPRRLTQDLALNSNPVWAADGHSLIYLASFDPEAVPGQAHLRRVALDGSVIDLVTGGFLSSHAALPDGRVAYLSSWASDSVPGTKGDLCVFDPASGKTETRATGLAVGVGGLFQPDMLALQMSMGSLVVSADATHAFAVVQRGGEGAIFKFALSGPESYEPVVEGERVCAPTCLRDDTMLFAGFNTCEPGDLYLLDTSKMTERRLTQLNGEVLGELELPSPQRLEFPSSDGASVEGWFLPPIDAQAPYPTVLCIHGGPHAGWGYTFNFDFLMLSGGGFGVLFVNYRGSTGYGDEFATKVNLDRINLGFSDLDYDDLMAGVDHTIRLGLADADRLGVWGVSAGGGLTGWIITHTDRFKAACPENPAFNMLSHYGTSDCGLWSGPAMLGGRPHERPEVYERSSPATYAHLCTTPTLFLQHEADFRCPAEQTEQFYTALHASGVIAEMLRFPGTGHLGSIVGPPSHRHAQNDAILEWMTRYVLGKEQA